MNVRQILNILTIKFIDINDRVNKSITLKKHKNYKLNLSYKSINLTSKISFILSIVLFLFSISYTLNSLNLVDLNQYNSFPIKKQHKIIKEMNSYKFDDIKEDINELNSRITNIYMWAMVFATFIVAIGLYQIYASRKIAEDIAKAEMHDINESKTKLEDEMSNVARNISILSMRDELTEGKDNVS